jgi:hypothetical protein
MKSLASLRRRPRSLVSLPIGRIPCYRSISDSTNPTAVRELAWP